MRLSSIQALLLIYPTTMKCPIYHKHGHARTRLRFTPASFISSVLSVRTTAIKAAADVSNTEFYAPGRSDSRAAAAWKTTSPPPFVEKLDDAAVDPVKCD